MKIGFELPALPYESNSLAPIITEETFEYHYGKHHATYVNNLIGLVKDTPFSEASIEQIVTESYRNNDTPMFNNAAQHWNHSFFWNCLSPDGGGNPKGNIQQLINRDFGGFDDFKSQFSNAALKLFGSGWAWLVQDESGKLEILALKDANTPITSDKKAILTIDVWEHAYYIDYRNARNKFIERFWDIVNWNFANENVAL